MLCAVPELAELVTTRRELSTVNEAPAVAALKPGMVFIGSAKITVPLLIGHFTCKVCPEPPATRLHASHLPSIDGCAFGSPDVKENVGGVLP